MLSISRHFLNPRPVDMVGISCGGYLLYEKVAMCANCARMKTFFNVLYLVLLKSPQLEKKTMFV